MKTKVKFFTAIFAVLVATVTLFAACNDEEEKMNFKEEIVNHQVVFNNSNPYDVYGEKLINCYHDFYHKINTGNLNTIDEYRSACFSSFNTRFYPVVDGSFINQIDTTIFSNLLSDFFSHIRLYGIVNASSYIENKILNSNCDANTKDILLLFISEYKYNEYYTQTILYTARNFEERLDNCMFNEAYDIFVTGSVVKQTLYIAGMPESYLAMLADCTYAAVFTPNEQRCQEKQPYANPKG